MIPNLQSTNYLLNRGVSDVASRFHLETNPNLTVRRVNLIAFPPLFTKTRKSDTITIKYPYRISVGMNGGEM